MYENRNDWDGDEHRHNSDVHYRLYLDRDLTLSAICVQDFDYPDYDATRIISKEAWNNEQEAEDAAVELFLKLSDDSTMMKILSSIHLPKSAIARQIRKFIDNLEGDRR